MDNEKKILEELYKQYEKYLGENLQINMARGKPSNAQLSLSNDLLNIKINYHTKENFDARNYGCLDGLLECKELFSEILDIKKENIIIGGNSTLNMIYDIISRFYIWGTNGQKPWGKCEKIKFICPCPGYDRHFDILEKFGIEMIPIELEKNGLNMEEIENLCINDDDIKGIICVPLYSNPTGTCYNDETILRLAKMQTKAKDFKIFWDNAYAIHYIYEKIQCLNLLKESEKFGNENRVLYFFSTSKITFAGGGVAILASGKEMIEETKKHMSVQTIGYDKINQLKTVAFLKNKENTLKLMDKHADILKEKFDIVLNKLNENFENGKMLKWEKPLGGYFVSVDTEKGCAKRVVKMCKNLGITLTDAGSTYPKKIDLKDTNIRIAPSFPEKEELEKAMDIFCLCVKIVSIENSFNN
ncbi:aminotransferase class I/II-fold pyridoxal phosphate-dependent enzyme [Campylobacter sp.]|uniref:aminotransferase class I/II-fold pyridoxal phosphate-dependent enzyme n=1 Tax=Campylobacter sp. TaxID=205 RepID=UPI0025BC2D63|nr:aminotransferase class I/II-fold pyridoxal phosphate-dependent enzyme [Campylobacter sp.]